MSAETLKALTDAKKALTKLQRQNRKSGQTGNEVWFRMMVDYWESRYYIEQTHGEREQARKELEEQMAIQAQQEEEQRLAREAEEKDREAQNLSSNLESISSDDDENLESKFKVRDRNTDEQSDNEDR